MQLTNTNTTTTTTTATAAASAATPTPDDRAVFFFDIDNCLYPKSSNVHAAMVALINKYFVTHLAMSAADATALHRRYYQDYGLAIEGLSRHHRIDPLDFNREVDDALPLDELLRPVDPELRRVLDRFDRTRVKMWLFTNAHVTHGLRVVRLLEIEDLFEGITYCDYATVPLVPKPTREMFEKAEREAGVVPDQTPVYFVDDSHLNCVAAYRRGWENTVHLLEPGLTEPDTKACRYQISHLRELLDLFPELLKK